MVTFWPSGQRFNVSLWNSYHNVSPRIVGQQGTDYSRLGPNLGTNLAFKLAEIAKTIDRRTLVSEKGRKR